MQFPRNAGVLAQRRILFIGGEALGVRTLACAFARLTQKAKKACMKSFKAAASGRTPKRLRRKSKNYAALGGTLALRFETASELPRCGFKPGM